MIDKSAAQRSLELGNRYPYDASDRWWRRSNSPRPPRAKDWAHKAARGILADLRDRRGIKHALENIDEDIRKEIVEAIAAVIRESAP